MEKSSMIAAVAAGIIGLSGFATIPARADDWPNWRGPEHTGISSEKGWFKPGTDLKELWRLELGNGYSSVAAAGNRVYTMGNIQNQDIIYCLDTSAGGKVIWKYSYPCKAADYPGPRSTPTLDGKHLYAFSRAGDLLCLDATAGNVVWSRALNTEQEASPPGWGFASSPLIHKNMVIVNAGQSGMAFDKTTGKTIWKSGKDGASYAVPVTYQQDGKPMVAIFAGRAVHGVDVGSGAVAWSFPWKTDFDVHAAAPVAIDRDKILISSGYNHGCALLAIGNGKASALWENKNLCSHFSSPVLYQGNLYGINGNVGGGEVRCIDPQTGSIKWRTKDPGFGSLMVADGKLIIMTENGRLVIAEAQGEAFKELYRKEILGGTCWTPPVLANGRIYCRNHPGTLVCLQFATP